ncbi:MAG: methanogen output domain 1-containing protein [Candidatus Aenigmarchaeota archaeon]|nr:methanogen output domain 1-containing protein [Candidatus Aenigmarchaeota archaeon]
MENEKLKELEAIKKEFDEKITEEMRTEAMARISSRMISTIARHLIKDAGYSVATTILQREFRNLGRNDAKEFIDTFELKKNDYKDASKALKIAALFLGLKLDAIENETIVRDCPQGAEAIKFREPILCNACSEYTNGILQEMLGEGYVLERTKWIFKGDSYCMFKIRKK